MKRGTRAMYRYVGPDAIQRAAEVHDAILAAPMYIVDSRLVSEANAEQTRRKLPGQYQCLYIEWGRHRLGTTLELVTKRDGDKSMLRLTEVCRLREVDFPLHDRAVLLNFEKFLRRWVPVRAAHVLSYEGFSPTNAFNHDVGTAMERLHTHIRFHYDLASEFLKVKHRTGHPSMANVHRAFAEHCIVDRVLRLYWKLV